MVIKGKILNDFITEVCDNGQKYIYCLLAFSLVQVDSLPRNLMPRT